MDEPPLPPTSPRTFSSPPPASSPNLLLALPRWPSPLSSPPFKPPAPFTSLSTSSPLSPGAARTTAPGQIRPAQPRRHKPLTAPPCRKMGTSPQESPLNPNPNAFTYQSPHPVYAMAVSSFPTSSPRLALGSFIEELTNRVDIITFDDDALAFRSDPALSFDHPYPPTKLMFHPRPLPNQSTTLLASSGEYLRLWQVHEAAAAAGGPLVELRTVFNSSKSSEFCAPLTSFDWNDAEPRRIGTSSIDTTCTVWDVERGVVETQLIAHDKEVYDIAWGPAGIFASVSADGSVRIFDLRDKEHSTIVYESPNPDTPLLRLAWNKMDLSYMATLLMDSNRVVILDIRSPATPVAELQRHQASVNAMAWAPQSHRHICSAGDDGQALIWDLPMTPAMSHEEIDPMLAYTAGAEINQLQWSAAQPDWISIAFSNKVQLLRV